MENFLSLFDQIAICKTEILSPEDKMEMESLQKEYTKCLTSLHTNYLRVMQHVKEHPTPNLKLSRWKWEWKDKPYSIDDKNTHDLSKHVFIPENTAAEIAFNALELTTEFENVILKYFNEKYRIHLSPEPILYKTLLPERWQEFSFKKQQGKSWPCSTSDVLNLEHNMKAPLTLPDNIYIPQWEDAVNNLIEQLDGLTFEEMKRKERKDSLTGRYDFRESRLTGSTVIIRTYERHIFSTERDKDSNADKIFFNRKDNEVFDLLMFYENKKDIAYPVISDKTTGFIKNSVEFYPELHNVKLALNGSEVCTAMTMMRNNSIKLHFKDTEAAERFHTWCRQ